MEQASSAFSTGVPALAAIPQLAGNSRQGFGLVDGTMRWASGFAISSNTLGIKGSLYDGDAGSRSTGKERDSESGNDYFGARYYSSAMGRWMSPDWSAKMEPVPYAKLDNPQSLNLYAYVMNNPLSRFDVDGHACTSLGSPTSANCSQAQHDALEAQAAKSPYRLTVKEDGTEGGRRRTIYEVKKLDKNGDLVPLGKGDPQFHVTEHQTSDKFGDTVKFGANDYRSNDTFDGGSNQPTSPSSYTPNKFTDSLGGIGDPTVSNQSFTISTSTGLNPSDAQPILVNLPGTRGASNPTGDHGVLSIDTRGGDVKINGTEPGYLR